MSTGKALVEADRNRKRVVAKQKGVSLDAGKLAELNKQWAGCMAFLNKLLPDEMRALEEGAVEVGATASVGSSGSGGSSSSSSSSSSRSRSAVANATINTPLPGEAIHPEVVRVCEPSDADEISDAEFDSQEPAAKRARTEARASTS